MKRENQQEAKLLTGGKRPAKGMTTGFASTDDLARRVVIVYEDRLENLGQSSPADASIRSDLGTVGSGHNNLTGPLKEQSDQTCDLSGNINILASSSSGKGNMNRMLKLLIVTSYSQTINSDHLFRAE